MMDAPGPAPPRILHVQKAKGIGGSERHIVDLCAALASRGFQPEILWLEEAGFALDELAGLCRGAGLPIARWPIRGHIDLGLVGRLRRRLTHDPPALLHLHLIHATLHGALAAHLAGLRQVIATRHGADGYQRRTPFRWAARLADRACRRVIVPTAWTAEYTRRWDGTPPEKLRIIPHGIDLQRWVLSGARRAALRRAARDAWGVAGDELVIGCVARLHPAKDHDTLLEAFAALLEEVPGAHLVLAGTGPREEELRARAVTQVRFLGHCTDVPAVLAGCDLAVLPTHHEGFGLAALEAMAAGLPLVATRIGPLAELIADGRTGLLVPPRDADALRGALRRLADDAALRGALGREAQAAARGYTLERMAAETAALYAEVLPPLGRGPTNRG